MPCLVIGVVDTPLMEYVAFIIDQRLIEVAGFGCFVALDLPWLLLHAGNLPTRFTQEITRVPKWILGQSWHLVAEHEGTTEFLEVGGIRQGFGFEHEDP